MKNLKTELERTIKQLDKKDKELTKTYIHDGLWTDIDSKMTGIEQTLEDERKKLDHDREKLMKRDNIVLYNVPENFCSFMP